MGNAELILILFGLSAMMTGVGVLVAVLRSSAHRDEFGESFERAKLKNEDL